MALLVAGCAAKPIPERKCPPLPELSARAGAEERANHYAVVIRLYAQCAGAPSGDQ
jgi:hypothetical protein